MCQIEADSSCFRWPTFAIDVLIQRLRDLRLGD